MTQEGNEYGSQSGFTLQEAGSSPPCTNKRGRDVHEEDSRATALGMGVRCEFARDLNLSRAVSIDDGGNKSEDLDSPLNNLTVSQSEKRLKCGPFDMESYWKNPSPSRPSANVDVVRTGSGNNVGTGKASQQDCTTAIAKVSVKVAEGMRSGITSDTRFLCDICSVTSTSVKDLEIHLAGKKHAKAVQLRAGVGKFKTGCHGSEAGVSTPLKNEVLAQNGSTHANSNMGTASTECHVSLQASKAHIPGCSVVNCMEEENRQSILYKCGDSKDAITVDAEQHTLTDSPSVEALVVGCDTSGIIADNHVHNQCEPGANGITPYPLLTDGRTENTFTRMTCEGGPHKHLLASLRSSSDCVAHALAAVSSMRGCPGPEKVPKSSCCDQGIECSDSFFQGTKRGGDNRDSNGMVIMHTSCFSNLLHEVRASATEDAIRQVGLKLNPWLPNSSPVSAASPQAEDLHCTVCLVEYGSKADLDLHLAGKKHASMVQRMSSRCQLCNLNCNSEKDFKLHQSGKRHASKLRLVQKRGTL